MLTPFRTITFSTVRKPEHITAKNGKKKLHFDRGKCGLIL
jgi:hypothetical protein